MLHAVHQQRIMHDNIIEPAIKGIGDMVRRLIKQRLPRLRDHPLIKCGRRLTDGAGWPAGKPKHGLSITLFIWKSQSLLSVAVTLAKLIEARHINVMADIIPSVPVAETQTSGAPAPAAAAPAGMDLMSMLPMVLIFAVFYMLLIRPQQKRAKEIKDQLANLKKGDEVITAGGLIGKVSSLGPDDEILVELTESVKVRALRSMLTVRTGMVVATGPVANDDKRSKKNKDSQPA